MRPSPIASVSVAPRWPKRSAAQMSGGNTRYASGSWVRSASSHAATVVARSRAGSTRSRPRPTRGNGAHHASASGTTTRAPHASPSHHVRQMVGMASVVITPPSAEGERADRRADRDAGRDRGEHAAEAVDRGERRAAPGQPHDEEGRDGDLEHVAACLADRRPERERAVVVGEEVADDHSRQVRETREVDERDADPNRQPDDCGDRPGELQVVAELRGAVVQRDQRRKPEQVTDVSPREHDPPWIVARHAGQQGDRRMLNDRRRPLGAGRGGRHSWDLTVESLDDSRRRQGDHAVHGPRTLSAMRHDGPELICAGVDDGDVGLRNLIPRPFEVTEGLGYDDPGVVGERGELLALGIVRL